MKRNLLFLDRFSNLQAHPYKQQQQQPSSPQLLSSDILFTMLSLSKLAIALGLVAGHALANSGDMTWFDPGLGACGATNGPNDFIVAMSPGEMKCGTNIKINYKGKSATAKIVDKCPGCAGGSIDVSPAVFKVFADLGVGRIHVDWAYV
ncbi:RlpA-like double-psi beta-barrel-protein domain-containing protein-containing protein [Xylaria bambusicola]|uniref:RlpA-like double-psi beta-barrel-protein domain-containing protein-containing protein n=1 Tax=Xylaria bambusicola TaxID=326684 RepID=UPI0020074E92|nr:RlpA-like double-psi beta-barrel-protein domain-containing protein-containing protein [Xylaria bambusicola]KAI0521396.1 RlpA-like double-psi beta-barrel-protein domain-containing protein-containing protein [Xylaria bambusicola]